MSDRSGSSGRSEGAAALSRLSMAYSDAVVSTRLVLEGVSILGDTSKAVVVARYMDEAVWIKLTEAIKAVLGDA